MEKFKAVSQDISSKQKMYMEVAKRASTASADNEANFAGAGANHQQQLLDQQTIKIQAETDFNSRVIDERQQVFNQAETLMNDINTIAGQINTNTKNQGQELVRADQNMTDVVENAEEAQKEIVQAQKYQKSTGKWLCWLLLIILVALGVVLCVVLIK